MEMKLGILVIGAVLIGGCANTKPHDNVPLVWKPTSEASLGSVSLSDVSGVTFFIPKFDDGRTNKKQIGLNTESSPNKTVTTGDNVGAWCTNQFVDLMKKQGMKVSESGNVKLIGEVVDFNVNEGDEYKARVSIRIKAVDLNGSVLWDGLLDGSASRYGRSYNLENYYETLTDAYIRGYRDLINNTTFLASMKNVGVTNDSVSQVQKNVRKKSKKPKPTNQ